MALAGTTFGLIETGVAHAAVSAPINLTVTDAAGPSINIDWDTPPTGDPIIYYRVVIDRPAPQVDTEVFLPSTQTNLNGIAVDYNTTYGISVFSHDGATSAGVGVWHTTPPGPPVECATATWAPFCTVEAFINQQYRDWLDRAPTFDELSYWRGYLTGGAAGTQSVHSTRSDYFINELRLTWDRVAGPVTRLYSAYFLRLPDAAGYRYWTQAALNGMSMDDISEFFARSPEFQARYGNLDNAEFVTLVYQNVLARPVDAEGLSYWRRQLDSGRSRGWVMNQMAEAPSFEFQNRTLSQVAAVEVWMEMLNRMPTLAELDYVKSILLPANYPLSAAEIDQVFTYVLQLNEYRARIAVR